MEQQPEDEKSEESPKVEKKKERPAYTKNRGHDSDFFDFDYISPDDTSQLMPLPEDTLRFEISRDTPAEITLLSVPANPNNDEFVLAVRNYASALNMLHIEQANWAESPEKTEVSEADMDFMAFADPIMQIALEDFHSAANDLYDTCVSMTEKGKGTETVRKFRQVAERAREWANEKINNRT